MMNVNINRRHDRRTLLPDEFVRLIEAAEAGPVVESIPSPDTMNVCSHIVRHEKCVAIESLPAPPIREVQADTRQATGTEVTIPQRRRCQEVSK